MDNAGKKPVWSVQPPKGMLKGDYYRIEERFPPYYPGVEGEFPADPGHLGIVEAVKADGKLIFVELNEITAPSLSLIHISSRASPVTTTTPSPSRPPRPSTRCCTA